MLASRNHIRAAGRRGESGFTLLELMVVIGIIAIIAAITIPRLLDATYAAYETNAHTFLRSIHQCEMQYHTKENRYATLAELRAAKLIGPTSPENYVIVLTLLPDGSGFNATATPLPKPDSMKHFWVDGTGVVRFAVGVPADDTSTPL